MFRYLLKRLLIFIPTLIAISLIAFGLSKMTPGDPLDRELPTDDEVSSNISKKNQLRELRAVAERLGLDKPSFYFSLTSAAYPDTLYRILVSHEKKLKKNLTDQCGNWVAVNNYYQSLEAFDKHLGSLPDTLTPNLRITLQKKMRRLYTLPQQSKIRVILRQLRDSASSNVLFHQQVATPLAQLSSRFETMHSEATLSKLYTPRVYWHGFDNQYHNWLTNFIQGEFGYALDGRRVIDKIDNAIWWTVIINLISMFLAFGIAIPLGVVSAVHRDSIFDKVTTVGLFILYSIPSFWLATMLVIFFTTPEYGCKIFASIGLGELSSLAPLADRFWETAAHLVLPIICTTYVSLAFISRQMRGSLLEVTQQDYIRTARAKGLDERKVIWKHAFRNSTFPLITMFAGLFPRAIGGSIIIEIIFNIPGMGRLVFNSILSEDWPVVFTVLMLVALLTVIGNFLADILYGVADPRVRLA